MDELDLVAAVLAAPDPSPDAVRRSRRRLRRAMRGPFRWQAVGAGLTAAAAAVAIVAIGGTPGAGAPAGEASARHVLLAAAVSAQHAPRRSGAFWHVRTVAGPLRYETWTRRDGRTWMRGAKTRGRVVEMARPAPFRLAGQAVGLRELRRLPADPAALKARIAREIRRGETPTGAGRLTAALRRRALLGALTALVSQLPAPPGIRAAAFRALATLPHVRRGGGAGLVIAVGGRRARLVVDPATGRVRDTSFLVTADGAELWLPGGRAATVTAGWTDRPPPGTS